MNFASSRLNGPRMIGSTSRSGPLGLTSNRRVKRLLEASTDSTRYVVTLPAQRARAAHQHFANGRLGHRHLVNRVLPPEERDFGLDLTADAQRAVAEQLDVAQVGSPLQLVARIAQKGKDLLGGPRQRQRLFNGKHVTGYKCCARQVPRR
jgi:hypothetical protein